MLKDTPRIHPFYLLLLTGLLLAGCASQVPQNIRQAPPNNPGIEDVLQGSVIEGQIWQVRWGGEILETENRENETLFTVLARPLSKGGEPKSSDNSDGRFIAIAPVFLDPKVYKPGRQLTVSGTLLNTQAHKIGEYVYTYPVVQVDSYYLWPQDITPPYYGYPSPWWRDPWYYDPWYYGPWYPNRYRH
jgi:outer membrane lipoprotein